MVKQHVVGVVMVTRYSTASRLLSSLPGDVIEVCEGSLVQISANAGRLYRTAVIVCDVVTSCSVSVARAA